MYFTHRSVQIFKILYRGFYSPGSDPPHKVIRYGVATISRLLKMIGLFCRILSLVWVSFAKETYHFKEPTNRSHPILVLTLNLVGFVLSFRSMRSGGNV